MNKTEWKLLFVDAINIKNIDCLECEVWCTKIIRTAQKKLLEYQNNIVEHDLNFSPLMELFKNWLSSMIKQLEEKNG